MFADELSGQPLPTSSRGRPFRGALRALAAAGTFLLWALRRGFFNAWPV
jgi:hypothetical protein